MSASQSFSQLVWPSHPSTLLFLSSSIPLTLPLTIPPSHPLFPHISGRWLCHQSQGEESSFPGFDPSTLRRRIKVTCTFYYILFYSNISYFSSPKDGVSILFFDYLIVLSSILFLQNTSLHYISPHYPKPHCTTPPHHPSPSLPSIHYPTLHHTTSPFTTTHHTSPHHHSLTTPPSPTHLFTHREEYDFGLNHEVCAVQLIKDLLNVTPEEMSRVVLACTYCYSLVLYPFLLFYLLFSLFFLTIFF